jgi:hypothetical protein
MKYFLAVVVFFVAAPLQAQTPRVQVFGGASAFHASEAGIRQNYFDGLGEVSINFTKHLGVVGDFGEERRPFSVGVVHSVLYQIQGLGGIEYGFHRRHLSPFLHGLGGYARTGVGPVRGCCDVAGGSFTIPGVYRSGYAVAVGGGADLTLTRLLAIRGVLDWVPEREHGPWTRNQYRVGVGLVFRFGFGHRAEARHQDSPTTPTLQPAAWKRS